MSPNVEIIRRWYESADRELLDPNIEWLIAEGFPSGGRYVGRKAVFEEFFPRLLSNFSEWGAKLDEILDAGDFVVALGHYRGRAKTTGAAIASPFAHVWKLDGGKIVQVRQYADTALIARALAGETSSVG